MSLYKSFVSIGAGNVASHIVKSLCNAGYKLIQVYSRTQESAKILADPANAEFTTSIEEIMQGADLYIVSIPDLSVPLILEQLKITNSLIVHTAGSHGLEVFGTKFTRYGVLYPLQTIRKNTAVNMAKSPFLIEANNPVVLAEIEEIARSISENVYLTDSETRRWIHLAAVFANNFTNHMLALSSEILNQKKLDQNLLRPLIEETFRKALESNPSEEQTGPAIRNDTNIIEKHIKMLENQPLLQKLYTFTSQSIQHTQSLKKNNSVNE